MVGFSDIDNSSRQIKEMEAAFRSAVKTGQIPGAVIMARDHSGKQTRIILSSSLSISTCNNRGSGPKAD